MSESILGNVAAAAILLLIQLLYRVVLKPIWRSVRYPGAKISGKWEITYPGDDRFAEIATIRQSGSKLSGTIEVVSGPDKGRSYRLDGEFLNRILTAVYVSRNSRRVDSGSFTMVHGKGGKAFEGFSAYTLDNEAIAADQCLWTWVATQ